MTQQNIKNQISNYLEIILKNKNYNNIFLNNGLKIPLYLIAPSGYAETAKIEHAYNYLQNYNLKINLINNFNDFNISFEIDQTQYQKIKTRSHYRFGGTELERLNDFDFKFVKPNSMIMPVRGGYGVSALLNKLDYQNIAKEIADKNLFVVGYSDFTAFQCALNQAVPTAKIFSGPMFAADFYYHNNFETADSKSTGTLTPNPSEYTILSLTEAYLKNYLKNYINNLENLENLENPKLYLSNYTTNYQQNLDQNPYQSNNFNCTPYNNQNFNENNNDNINLKKLKYKNAKLWGGNLSMISHLIGSDYFPKFNINNIEKNINNNYNNILWLEDIAEAPYVIDRMLYQLYHAGVLNAQKAIILGQFNQYKTSNYDQGYDLNIVFENWQQILKKHGVDLLTGLNFGHTYHKQTLGFMQEYDIYV